MAPVTSKVVPSVYLASSVCRSLQCLISALTQVGEQISLACVGSAHSVWATLGLPAPPSPLPLTAYVLSQFTLLRLQVALQGAGPGLHALPRSKLLRFRFSGTPQRHMLGLRFVPLHGQSSSSDQVFGQHTLPRCSASYHLTGPSRSVSGVRPSLVCSVSLLGS